MAEGLPIVSGIAGLISLTIEVFGIGYKYVNGVRDASSSTRRFLKEIENLQIVLLRVEQCTTQNNQVAIFGDTGSCLLSIQKSNEYFDLLQKIRDRLQRQTFSSFHIDVKALTWPFSEKETLALTESLHRYLEIYNTALAVDSLTIGQITLSEVRQIGSSQEDSRVKAILKWLSPMEMYQKQQDTLSRRHGITGSWLLIDPVFKSWLDGDCSQPTLWCPGDPGTGKTILTSIVIDHLLNNYVDENTRIAYIYCDYKDQAVQTASNLVACLVRQIIEHSALPERLVALYEELGKQNRRPSFDDLKSLLVALCSQSSRTYIVVDALDECEANRERRLFLPVFEDLPDSTTKIFVTSRPNNEDIFQSLSRASQITITASELDLRKYIIERIDERKDFVNRVTPELKENIISAISTGASGMFLLAALQIDRIFANRTVKGIKSELDLVPDGLDELYQQALDRIKKQAGDDGALGIRILGWITHARRPLSVNELRYGLAVEYDKKKEESPARFDEDNLLSPGSLVDVCAGLVIVESSSQRIRLVHYTTQEYFDKTRSHLFEDVEVDISRACLTYLSYDIGTEFEEIKYEILQSYPFLSYACHYWFSHVNSNLLAENPDAVLLNAVARFKNLDCMSRSIDILRNIILGDAWTRKLGIDFAGVRGSRTFPLEVASRMGLEELVTVLLDRRTGSCPGLDTSLIFASYSNPLEVVKILLEHGASVDGTFDIAIGGVTESYTALSAACRRGHVSIVGLLIENGADIHGRLTPRWPPIHTAAKYGWPVITDLLLKSGVDINRRNSNGQTACHVAADSSEENSLAYLLHAGCNLEVKDDNGDTPLHLAAENARPETVELLFQKGADLFAEDDIGLTSRDVLDDRLARSDYIPGGYEPGEHERIERIIALLHQLEEEPFLFTSVESTTANQIPPEP